MKTFLFCFISSIGLMFSTPLSAGTLIDSVELVGSSAPAAALSRIKATDEATADQTISHTINWHLKRAGRVTMLICDLQGHIVKTFIDKEEKPAADYSFSWDGRDDDGAVCQTGLYFPVIRVNSVDRGVDTYNPTALPWGEEIIPENVEYDTAKKVITYTLRQSAFLRIRVGEGDGGPLYKTVSDWKLQPPGSYEVPWDGMDISGIIKAAETEKFRIAIDAFSLPQNTILITDSSLKQTSKETVAKYKQFPVYPPHGTRIAFYPTLPNGLLPDLLMTTGFSQTTRKKGGRYKVSGQIPISLNISHGIVSEDSGETIEALLYVDGLMVKEDKIVKLPSRIMIDTTKLSNGDHVVTVNLRTSGDRAASSSMNIFVNN